MFYVTGPFLVYIRNSKGQGFTCVTERTPVLNTTSYMLNIPTGLAPLPGGKLVVPSHQVVDVILQVTSFNPWLAWDTMCWAFKTVKIFRPKGLAYDASKGERNSVMYNIYFLNNNLCGVPLDFNDNHPSIVFSIGPLWPQVVRLYDLTGGTSAKGYLHFSGVNY